MRNSGILWFAAALALVVQATDAEAVTAEQLRGKTVYFGGGAGSASFGADGSYIYQGQGVRRRGTYTIRGNEIHIRFRDGGTRRDTIIPGKMILQDQGGRQHRFSVN